MQLFENMLLLLALAVLLLQVSRRMSLPYPSMLALAGAVAGLLPWAPQVSIEPHLALVLFIAPALLDAAYDTSPRELVRNWLPLTALVVVAVLLTTAAVAWVGWAHGGLPLAAAVTLGAIVAPPDAVAGTTVMQNFRIPRRTLSIINGESLLNDAVALLIFGAAAAAAMTPHLAISSQLPILAASVPAGALLGYLLGKAFVHLAPIVAGTMSATIVEFVMTFGAWLVAEHLKISPIIAVVVFGMTVARYFPSRSNARDRVHSYAVWGAAVFALNVLAFLLMGLQARNIIAQLSGQARMDALAFAGAVLGAVIVVRLAWVLAYGTVIRALHPAFERLGVEVPVAPKQVGVLVGWSGMRGLVTLATAFALPADFPGRDTIVLTAFAVVLGTLVVQGLTLGPLIKRLGIQPDHSLEHELASARTRLVDAALQVLEGQETHKPGIAEVIQELRADRRALSNPAEASTVTELDEARLQALRSQRRLLHELRASGKIEDDVFHVIEEELDWAELNASAAAQARIASV